MQTSVQTQVLRRAATSYSASATCASCSYSTTVTKRTAPPRSADFKTSPRFHDSLAGPSAPNAQHFLLQDRPNVAFTIRPAPSPLPPTMPPLPAAVSGSNQDGTVEPDEAALPPRLHPESETARATLSPEQIQEMQELRLSDPTKWTRSRLAKKYNVSPFFVGITGFGEGSQAKMAEKQAVARNEHKQERMLERYGLRRRITSEVRRLRKLHW